MRRRDARWRSTSKQAEQTESVARVRPLQVRPSKIPGRADAEAEFDWAPTLALACVAAALILRSRHMRADTSGDRASTGTSR